MANRRRTIEIWDNYWKELPTLVYLIFMLSIAAQMTLVFMGGMLFFKANWLWSLLVALGTGILTYIICYLMIQAKADIQHPRGFRISFFLTLPYASLVFFGGMAACNHWGYRDMQLAEFQQSAQYISTKSRQIIRAFEEDRDDVILAITDRCKSCSKRSTSTKRDRDASRLEVCLGTSKAKACADFDSSVKSDLETFAKGKMEASSGALDSLQQLLMDIDNNGIVGHLNQYSIQERLKRALYSWNKQPATSPPPRASFPKRMAPASILRFLSQPRSKARKSTQIAAAPPMCFALVGAGSQCCFCSLSFWAH